MIHAQRATNEGTARYANRFKTIYKEGHYRESNGLHLSSIGLGSYLGNPDNQTDLAYISAINKALEIGCNVIDTASNYRFQRSERSISEALQSAFQNQLASRDEVIISTKGGYIPFDTHSPVNSDDALNYIKETFIDTGVCQWEDFVQGSHCMTPDYISNQLDQSLKNLKLETIDIYYIHNPESQLAEVSVEAFYERLRDAFEFLETAAADGKISMYGVATWNGFRTSPSSREYLSLYKIIETARSVGGPNHHFKVVQLPLNLAMTEAFTNQNQLGQGRMISLLEAASELGITVMSSASIFQGRLPNPKEALQFATSTPGLTTALVGMSKVKHVMENMEVAKSDTKF